MKPLNEVTLPEFIIFFILLAAIMMFAGIIGMILIPVLLIWGGYKLYKIFFKKPSTVSLIKIIDQIDSPFDDPQTFTQVYAEYLVDLWTTHPRMEIFSTLVNTAETLYASHNFIPLKPNAPETNDEILQARYRDQLIRGIETGLDAPRIIQIITIAFTDAFTELLRKLPPSSFTKDVTNQEPAVFTAPLYDVVRNPGQAVADMIQAFQTSEVQELKLFAPLREQLNRNLYEASGLKAPAPQGKLVHPYEYKAAPKEIVAAYLGYTPLQDIFEVQVPFP